MAKEPKKDPKKEDKAAPEAGEAVPAASSGRMKLVVMIVVAVLVSMSVAGGAVWWFLGHHASSKAEPKLPDKAVYYDLTPAFTVTLTDPDTGNLRYMQANVTIMTRIPKVVDDLKSYDPEIRNDLNMLYSGYHPAQLMSAAGREALEKRSLAEVNQVLAHETGRKNACDSFLFTSFVVQ